MVYDGSEYHLLKFIVPCRMYKSLVHLNVLLGDRRVPCGMYKSFSRPSVLCGARRDPCRKDKILSPPQGTLCGVRRVPSRKDKKVSPPQCTLWCSTSPIVAGIALKAQYRLNLVSVVFDDSHVTGIKAYPTSMYCVGLDESHV